MRQLHVDGGLIEDTQARLFGEKKPFETGLILGRVSPSPPLLYNSIVREACACM